MSYVLRPGKMFGANAGMVMRSLHIALALGALSAAAAAAPALGSVSVETSLGRMKPVARTLEHGPHHNLQLRFTIVDSAGAAVHRWPGGPIVGVLSTTSPLGYRSWAWALSTTSDGRWASIVLPWRPNGRTGWIDLNGRREIRTAVWVRADVSQRVVVLQRGRRTIAVFRAAVGAADSRTPTGRFDVTDLVPTGDPSGPFGWFAFGLSGHQPNLPPGWSGGDQLAIHGTNNPASIGMAASAGCLRVSAHALAILRQYVRLGTPVVIKP
jgi:lipoprotein-anchoring transpeptidase ErfK/SrfK